MKYLLLLLIFLVGCSSYAYLEIEGVLGDVTNSSIDIFNVSNGSVQGRTFIRYFPPVSKISISLFAVDEDGTKCGIRVNDEIVWINENRQKTVNGLKINVFDVILHRAKSKSATCQVLIAGQIFFLTTK